MQQRLSEFDQGYQAWRQGLFDNPYKPHTAKGKSWQHGQDVAYIDQQKRLGCYEPGPRIPSLVVNLRQMVRDLRAAGFVVAAAHIEKHGLHR